ncbi:MAG: hypothetical protein V3V88_03030, partial [Dehalococcoidia bacterium]
MIKRTYGDLKSRLGRVAAINGFKTTDARLLERVNDALEDLMESEDTPFVIDFYNFTVTNGNYSQPSSIDRIVNLSINNDPRHYRSPWYEYIDNALGPITDTNDERIFVERGEAPTYDPVPSTGGPYVLKIEALEDETVGGTLAPTVHIRGLDENGAPVLENGTEGIDVTLPGGPGPWTVATTQRFSKVTSFIKPMTRNRINLYARTDPGGVDTQIGLYEPKDTTASFRQYFIPGLSQTESTTLDIRGKRRFVPITDDNDELPISNFQALKHMLIYHHKSETQDENASIQ